MLLALKTSVNEGMVKHAEGKRDKQTVNLYVMEFNKGKYKAFSRRRVSMYICSVIWIDVFKIHFF